MERQQLFRQEAIDAQQAQWMGTVRLSRPPIYSVVTAVALICAFALIAFTTWGQVARKTPVAGLLMPDLGLLSITSSQAGVLIESRVTEGQQVRAGDVLFVLDSSQRSSEGETSALVEQQIEARLDAGYRSASTRKPGASEATSTDRSTREHEPRTFSAG